MQTSSEVQKQHNSASGLIPTVHSVQPRLPRPLDTRSSPAACPGSGFRHPAARPRRRSNHASRPPPPPPPSAPRRQIHHQEPDTAHAMLRNFPQARRLLRSTPSFPAGTSAACASAFPRPRPCLRRFLIVMIGGWGAGGWGSRRRTPTSGSRWARPRSAPTRSSASPGSGTRRRHSGGGRSSRAPRFPQLPPVSSSLVRSFVRWAALNSAKFPILLEVD